jgi:hypothetical protein
MVYKTIALPLSYLGVRVFYQENEQGSYKLPYVAVIWKWVPRTLIQVG